MRIKTIAFHRRNSPRSLQRAELGISPSWKQNALCSHDGLARKPAAYRPSEYSTVSVSRDRRSAAIISRDTSAMASSRFSEGETPPLECDIEGWQTGDSSPAQRLIRTVRKKSNVCGHRFNVRFKSIIPLFFVSSSCSSRWCTLHVYSRNRMKPREIEEFK